MTSQTSPEETSEREEELMEGERGGQAEEDAQMWGWGVDNRSKSSQFLVTAGNKDAIKEPMGRQ